MCLFTTFCLNFITKELILLPIFVNCVITLSWFILSKIGKVEDFHIFNIGKWEGMLEENWGSSPANNSSPFQNLFWHNILKPGAHISGLYKKHSEWLLSDDHYSHLINTYQLLNQGKWLTEEMYVPKTWKFVQTKWGPLAKSKIYPLIYFQSMKSNILDRNNINWYRTYKMITITFCSWKKCLFTFFSL